MTETFHFLQVATAAGHTDFEVPSWTAKTWEEFSSKTHPKPQGFSILNSAGCSNVYHSRSVNEVASFASNAKADQGASFLVIIAYQNWVADHLKLDHLGQRQLL